MIWPLFGLSPPADGELTQDLLYRPPIESKLSDEPSSNRLDTILADRNRTAISPMISRFPCLCRWSGFAVRFGSVTGEVFPGADRVMAAQC